MERMYMFIIMMPQSFQFVFCMNCFAVAQLMFPETSTEARFSSIGSALPIVTLFKFATTLPIVTINLYMPRSSPTVTFRQSSQ